MARFRFLPLAAALCVAAVLILAAGPYPRSAQAEDEKGEAKAGPTGPTYRNKGLGVRTSGPAGWQMVADKTGAVSAWKRLATWNHKPTAAQVVLYSRPRASTTLDSLMGEVRTEWNKSTSRLRLDAMRKIDKSALNPIGKVIVDGSFTRKKQAKPTKDGVPAPPAERIPMKVQATYYLGEGHEFLMYVTTRASHWTRLRKDLRAMRDGLAFDQDVTAGPTGEGAFRDEELQFACRFPKGHTVVRPARRHHVVKFAGLAATDPVLSVYAFPYEGAAGDDAARLVTYYREDKAGEAERKRTEVSGTEGAEVIASAMIDGTEQKIFIAVVKRGETCFRLRCVVPLADAAKGEVAYRAFLQSFRFGG